MAKNTIQEHSSEEVGSVGLAALRKQIGDGSGRPREHGDGERHTSPPAPTDRATAVGERSKRDGAEDSSGTGWSERVAPAPIGGATCTVGFPSNAYKADSDRVFCHPEKGSTDSYETFEAALRAAYARAGMDWPERFRPFHDLRVTSITNDAIAGGTRWR